MKDAENLLKQWVRRSTSETPMKRYLIALAIFAGSAAVIAVAGVNTEVFACGASSCSHASVAKDETPPFRPLCSVGIDCPGL